jgi:predicted permease
MLRALLWLYPSRHRREYGEEMIAVAEHRRGRANGRTGLGTGLVLAWDLFWGALGVWKDTTGRWTMGMGRGWGLDARFLARSLWRSRGYVATAVLVLAAAVAVNVTVFSYVRGTLLNEPPYPEPESIMIVWGSNPTDGQLRDVISGPTYIDLKERVTSLEPLAAFNHDAAYLTLEHPEVVDAMEVTVEFMDVLGVLPAMGRLFDERDRTSAAAATVVVTHAFWRDRLASDRDAVGAPIDIEGVPHTVIGVLPEGFEFMAPAPLFLPLRDDVLAADNRSRIHYHVLGRLRPGAAVADANMDAASVMAGILAEYPFYEGWSFRVEPLHEVSVEAVRPVIVILAVTVALVLLVALMNLATLFRIRALTRAGELGLRAALGAGRGTLLRVLALEAIALATVGAMLGLALSPFLLDAVTEMVPVWIAIPDSAARVPVLQAVLDPAVAATAFAAALLGALALTGPAFASALRAASPTPETGGRVRAGIRSTRLLVGFELAVATILCIGAALTARSAENLLSEDVGLEAEGLLTLYVGDVWGLPPGEQVQYFRDVVEQVERIPGVRRAGVIDYVDFQAEDDYAGITFLDRELQRRAQVRAEWRRVDAGLFEAAGMSVVLGRGLEAADFFGSPRAVVVNQTFASEHYPGGSAVGEYVTLHEDAYTAVEIVGVVADVRSLGPAAPPPAMLYAPNQGAPRGTQGLYVRVEGDPMAIASQVRDAAWSVDPSQPIAGISSMTDLVEAWVAIPRATRALVLGLATLAWLLSAVGVFGVVAYALRTRRAELGIRLALGASPDRLEVDQLRAISPIVVLGVGSGLVLGVLGARAAGAILYGVAPTDPVALGVAAVVMCAAALTATYLPARRAARIDPSEVIRTE